MHTVFNREPFTSWKIVLVDRYIDKTMEEIEAEDPNCLDYMEFTCTYRTKYHDNKMCEQFTIMSNIADYVFFQIHIFKNGDIKQYSQMPVSVNINKRKKRIEILPLVYCKVNLENNTIDFKPIEN